MSPRLILELIQLIVYIIKEFKSGSSKAEIETAIKTAKETKNTQSLEDIVNDKVDDTPKP